MKTRIKQKMKSHKKSHKKNLLWRKADLSLRRKTLL